MSDTPAVPKTTHVSELEARAVAEASRETAWEAPSFVRELFLGSLRLDLIHPYREPDAEEQARAKPFLEKLERFLETEVDPEEVERAGKIPTRVIDRLKELGAFGIKIPREYGGLGLSQYTYGRAMGLVGTRCGAMVALLSAHQSIGVPTPLKMFGTEEQKKRLLPRLAQGAISAFALTEVDVGSDPARMSTTATPTADGSAYILNGEKLWCTNGTIAELMVVMARTPGKSGKPGPIGAFIVETSTPGFEVLHRLEFMGIRGIENAMLRFTNVRVPKENLLWGEGKGLKLALITLNTGRLTLPATCASSAKWCVQVARRFAEERVQWGKPVGHHEAVAQMLAEMAARTYAMEAISDLCALLGDAGRSDIRLEAAIAKLWNSDVAWEIADQAVQVRGGRGYETAHSLATRGEAPIPLEQVFRDLRINRIFEGTNQVMRLFIAREALDQHLEVAGDVVMPKVPLGKRLTGLVRATAFYAWWYIRAAGSGGTLAALRRVRAARDPYEVRRSHVAPSRAPAIPSHDAPRSRARAPPGPAVPLRRHRRRAVRDGGRVCARHPRRPHGAAGRESGRAGGPVLPDRAQQGRGAVRGDPQQRRPRRLSGCARPARRALRLARGRHRRRTRRSGACGTSGQGRRRRSLTARRPRAIAAARRENPSRPRTPRRRCPGLHR
jgi:alkylation response protein AidB-like acyl-CoA dehydrogenase